MARKDLMKNLMGDSPPTPNARVDAAKPRYAKGAIGAVSKSIEDLKRRAIVDIDPRMIDGAGLKDRIDETDTDLAALGGSIETYGQQVPVLLRVSPNDPERYEIVYGRRRVAAMRALGMHVKALIRDLNDRDLILAQGQENSARKDLTFIEKANFARQMRDEYYDRKTIGDALSMDKTLISRLLQVADAVPVAVIEAIGSAPSVGRDRWLDLAGKLQGQDVSGTAIGDTSDARFAAVIAALSPIPASAPPIAPQQVTSGDTVLAEVKSTKTVTVVTLPKKTNAGFDTWLVENLNRIHRDWENQRDE